jgi:hydroxyacylglutathione hydrolase
VAGFEVIPFNAPELGNASFLVADPDTGEAVAIDAFRDVDRYLAAVDARGLKLVRALDTHRHNDFVSGARELGHETGAAIDPLPAGQELRVGHWTLRALSTPGHTPEHLSYLLLEDDRPRCLFSGGAVMVGGIARTDLFGPHLAVHLALEAYRTLKVRLRGLPDDVGVYPTHGAGSFCGSGAGGGGHATTLGDERRLNPFFTTDELMPFIARALHTSRYPAYYREMAEINAHGMPFRGHKPFDVRPLKPYQVETMTRERKAAIVDLRMPDEYDALHIPGSYSIGLGGGAFSAWAGWLLDRRRPIVLTGLDAAAAAEANRQLFRIGYDHVLGRLEGGVEAWRDAGLPVSSFERAEIEDLATWILSAEPMTVIDARAEEEWVHGHVPGAVHLYVPDIPHHADELPREAPVAVHCRSGYRAAIAASLLEQAGLRRIIRVAGKYSEWESELRLAETVPG